MLINLYKFVKQRIRDSKIFFKLIVFTILISALPLLLISIILNSKMEKIIENELSVSYEQLVDQYVSSINYKTDIYQTLNDNVSSNINIVDLLAHQDKETSMEAYDLGKKISKEVGLLLGARNIKELYNIMIYSFDEKNPIYGPKISNIEAIKDEKWFENNMKKNKVSDFFLYKVPGINYDILSFTKVIVDSSDANYGKKLGLIKLDVKTSSFFGTTMNYNKGQDANIYIIKGDKVMYSGDGSSLPRISKAVLKNMLDNDNGMEYTKISGEKVIIVYKNISLTGLKAVFIYHYGEIEKKASDIRLTIIYFAIITILVILCFTIMFSRKFSERIKILVNKMEKVENGDMEITEKIYGNDEIGMVDKHFNKMVGKLQYLINNNYIQQLEKREAELNALQLQINPHFLYNTLEIINSIAAVKNCYEICEISQKLGEMFRYSINTNKSEFITLEKELKHIENYIFIQKYRFKDKFEVFFSMEPEVLKCRVLRFILQPIVENAILHGFKNNEKHGCIEIAASVENNQLIIKIEDDGNGISEEQVEDLNNYINRRNENLTMDYERSIGIKNVNMRIKLACGDEYGILISSKINVGTQVVFMLPLYNS